MRLTWSSLDSHLDYISSNIKNQYMGDKKTQKKFVKEYLEMLSLLGKLLQIIMTNSTKKKMLKQAERNAKSKKRIKK